MADVQQLCGILQIDPVRASNLLDSAGGDVAVAMNIFYDSQATPPPPQRDPLPPPAPVAPPSTDAAAPSPPDINHGKMISLRLRGPDGSTHTIQVGDESPVIEFQKLVGEKVGVPPSSQQLLAGYPPKPLDTANPTATLSDLGVRSGEQFTVQHSKSEGQVMKGQLKGKYIPPYKNPKGSFRKREMPGDNSCLFHACNYVIEDKARGIEKAMELRRTVAEIVLANPSKFTTAFLGRPNAEYAAWIQRKDTWGGAIELSILSFLKQTEIFALDIQTAKLYRYGEKEGYTTRAFLLFSGNHYDAMTMAPYGGAPESEDQVLFSSTDEAVLAKAQDYVMTEYLRLASR